MAKQRLILLFDGTWNDPETQTNVFRLASLLKDYDGDTRQRFFYHAGVGTGKFDRFLGGVFGVGLTDNLLEGYQWLSKRYTDGDEIWLFGFSRGAYTARSLGGLLRKCGLLNIYNPKLLTEAMRIYRDKNLHPDCNECRAFRSQYSKTPRIRFIGVWDTVGALGIPGTFISEHGKYSWHDTELSSLVDYAYHAIALDEHRAAYDAALWVGDDGEKKPANVEIEQRWFIGAHANVGGGYGPDDALADLPLQWMMEKAGNVGLKLHNFTPAENAWEMNPRDSYKEFISGLYSVAQKIKNMGGDGRHYRSFSHGWQDNPAVNITIDASVWSRWQDSIFDYRPQTLVSADQHPPAPLPD